MESGCRKWVRHADSECPWLQEERVALVQALEGEGGPLAWHAQESSRLVNGGRPHLFGDE